jgi:hypothetical protein
MHRFALAAALALPAAALADKSFTGSGAGATWDCTHDPVVVITTSGARFDVSGDCKSIEVTGHHNTISIASVGTLDLTGEGNTVGIGAVDAIHINGAGNTVRWQKAKASEKPSIDTLGPKNVVTQGS